MDPKKINTNPIGNSTLGSEPVVDDSVTAASDINTPQTPVIPTVSEPAATAPVQPVDEIPYAVSEEPTAPEPTVTVPITEAPAEPAIPEPEGLGTPVVENTVMPDEDAFVGTKPTGLDTPMVENTVMPDADATVATKPVKPVGPATNTTKFQA